MGEIRNVGFKVIIGGALAYAFVVVLLCPCTPVLACHIPQFFIALSVAFFASVLAIALS